MPMWASPAVAVQSRHQASIVDTEDGGDRSSRKINGVEVAFAQQEAMPYSASVEVVAHNFTSIVDSLRRSLGGTGEINWAEGSFAQEVSVAHAATVVTSHNFADIVNRLGKGACRASEVNC